MLPVLTSPYPYGRTREAFNTCLAIAISGLLLASAVPLRGGPLRAVADLFGRQAVAAEQEGADQAQAKSSQSDATASETLNPRMRAALDYAARRYRVSSSALEPVFAIVQSTAREVRLDPLLIVAVIAIESRFNPLSQSESGAQGLMQLIPRYHRDKLPRDAGKLSFFDPVINVRIGSQALCDFIRRSGSVVAGLQRFAGESNDPDLSYSAKVLAERDRLASSLRKTPERDPALS